MDKKEPAEEKDLAKQQRLVGSMAHLALQGVGNFSLFYLKLNLFVLRSIVEAVTSNPEYGKDKDEESGAGRGKDPSQGGKAPLGGKN